MHDGDLLVAHEHWRPHHSHLGGGGDCKKLFFAPQNLALSKLFFGPPKLITIDYD